MPRKNSVRKGRRAEQEVARLLYKMFFGKEPPKERDVFIRTGFGHRQLDGDIVVPFSFAFIIEVKDRKTTLERLLRELREWARPYDNLNRPSKRLLIIFKFERKWWCAIEGELPPSEEFNFFIYRSKDISFTVVPFHIFSLLYMRGELNFLFGDKLFPWDTMCPKLP